jgi:hypothetical protein
MIDASRPVIGVPAGPLFNAAGMDYHPAQARTVLCWLEVADADVVDLPSLLSIPDPTLAAARVSSGGVGRPGHAILTVELRHDLDEDQIVDAARSSVQRLGILRPGAHMQDVRNGSVRSFTLPTADNAHLFARAAAQLSESHLDIEIVGAATAFGADTLGENIIQGLRAAEVLAA